MPYSLGEKITRYREKNNITKAEFGRKLGCQSNQLKMWEDGVFHPSLKNCYKLCKIMGVTIHEFLPLKYKDL